MCVCVRFLGLEETKMWTEDVSRCSYHPRRSRSLVRAWRHTDGARGGGGNCIPPTRTRIRMLTRSSADDGPVKIKKPRWQGASAACTAIQFSIEEVTAANKRPVDCTPETYLRDVCTIHMYYIYNVYLRRAVCFVVVFYLIQIVTPPPIHVPSKFHRAQRVLTYLLLVRVHLNILLNSILVVYYSGCS